MRIFYSVLGAMVLSLIFSCSNDKKNTDANSDLINISQSANGNADSSKMPIMIFAEESHDFGRMTQGEKVSYSFKFKNEGKSDLIITEARGSCGCTVPNYPKTPIKPTEEATIDVTFDSEGKSGKVTKTVTVVTNCTPNTKVITIYAEIVVPE